MGWTNRPRRPEAAHGLLIGAFTMTVAAAPACSFDSTDDRRLGPDAVGTSPSSLRGGEVIIGGAGIADLGGCGGAIIAPNVIVTAAHCLRGLGPPGAKRGETGAFLQYYDPEEGRRPIYNGRVHWAVYPTFDWEAGSVGEANHDVGILSIDGRFTDTDYHDYMRVYDDSRRHLETNLTAYGAGIHTYSGRNDDNLRTTWFEVESVEAHHIVVDTRDDTSVCHFDSGSALVYTARDAEHEIPMLAGVLSGSEHAWNDHCTNNSLGIDDAFYARVHRERLEWIESETGIECRAMDSTRSYLRCFDLPFIEDVPYEGLDQGTAVAITTSII